MHAGMNRRSLLAALLALPVSAGFANAANAASGYSRHALNLVRRTLVIDMLAPLKLDYTPDDYAETLSPTAVAEFKSSGVTGFNNSTGISGPDAYAEVLRYMAGWNGFIAAQADDFLLVRRAQDLDRAKASGKIAVIMGLQNSEHFRTPADVAAFYGLGQRVSQLTYNSQNLIGSGSTDRVDGGISDFGAAIIKAMNEAGMLIDVSHCGDRTTLDAIEISKTPIAITHTNCRSLVRGHPRLKTDEAIQKCAAKGGVIGISGVRNFVKADEPTTVEHIVDHIDHVVKLSGPDHVGIGSDLDLHGRDGMGADRKAMLRSAYKGSYAFRDKLDTDGFDHPRRIFDLTDALIRRGYADNHIQSILGGNFRRLLGQIWK